MALLLAPLWLAAPAPARADTALPERIDQDNRTIVLTGRIQIDRTVKIYGSNNVIRGDGAVIVKPRNDLNAFMIYGANNVLHGLRIETPPEAGKGPGSGVVVFGPGNTLSALEVTGQGMHGIVLHGDNSDCRGNSVVASRVWGNGGIGVANNNCQHTLVSSVTSRQNGLEGVTFDVGSDNGILLNSVLEGNVRAGVGEVGIDRSRNVSILGTQFGANAKPQIRVQDNGGLSSQVVLGGNKLAPGACAISRRDDDPKRTVFIDGKPMHGACQAVP